MTDNKQKTLRYAGLFRRLFAIFYDGFLLLAILFIVTAIANTLNSGNAIEPGNVYYPLYVLIIVVLSYLYFAWFWIHGGQTLGMKTWQIQLQTGDARVFDWKAAAIRFLAAIVSWLPLGAGFLWSFIDKKNRCWHDLVSDTVLIDLRS
ncbi:MAG: RDD family protein [Proteobacteria bacterium]|nr:RDD family protein [Pseudomonadota bacterium]